MKENKSNLFKLPFWYDETTQSVFDNNNEQVLGILGWNACLKATKNKERKSLELQDRFGKYVADILNKDIYQKDAP